VLLIDAYNVVRAQWVLPESRRGLDVAALIHLIGRSRYAKRRLRVVVDGRPGPDWLRHGVFDTLAGHAWTRLGRAEVVFSGREREADDVIEDILARTKGISITVVSSDRRLIRAAGRAGADQIGNGSFLRQLNEDLDRAHAERIPAFAAEVPLDRYSVAHWMKEFGFEPETAAPTGPNIATPAPTAPAEPRPPKKTPAKDRPAAPTPDGFGSRLRLDLPLPVPPNLAPPKPPAPPTSNPEAEEPLDPLLHDAFEEWYGALHLGDLDMRKWLDGIEPI
tara:strand:- start:722 stop:1552 length:831 start_codon:yes stop_codon:yes gene_type:complete